MLASILGASPPVSAPVTSSGKGITFPSADASFPLSGTVDVDAQFDKIVSFNQIGAPPKSDGALISWSPLVKTNVLAGSSLRVLAQKNSDWRNLIKHEPSVLVTDTACVPGWSSSAPAAPKCELLATADSSGRVIVTGIALLSAAADPSDPNRRLLQRKLADFVVPGEGATLLRWHVAFPMSLFVARGEKIWVAELEGMGFPADAFPPAVKVTSPAAPSWLAEPTPAPGASVASGVKLVTVYSGGQQVTSFDVAENSRGGFVAVVALDGGAGVHLVDEEGLDTTHLSGSAAWSTPLVARIIRSETAGTPYGVVVVDGAGGVRVVSVGARGTHGATHKIECLAAAQSGRLVVSAPLSLDSADVLIAVGSSESPGLSLLSLGLCGDANAKEWQFTHGLRIGGAPGPISSIALSHPHVLAAITDADASKLNTIELVVLTPTPGQVTLLRVHVADALPSDRENRPLQRSSQSDGSRPTSSEEEEMPSSDSRPTSSEEQEMPLLESTSENEPNVTPLAFELLAPAACADAESTSSPLLTPAAAAGGPEPSLPPFDSAAFTASLSSALGATLDAQSASLTNAIACALDASLGTIPVLVQDGLKAMNDESLAAATVAVREAALESFTSAFRDTAVPAFERAAAAMVSQIVSGIAGEMKAAVASTGAEFKAQREAMVADLKALRDSAATEVASAREATTNATVELGRSIEALKRMRADASKNSEASLAETTRVSATLAAGAEALLSEAQSRGDDVRALSREVADLRTAISSACAQMASAASSFQARQTAPPPLPQPMQQQQQWAPPSVPQAVPYASSSAPAWSAPPAPPLPSTVFPALSGPLSPSEHALSILMASRDTVKALRACASTKQVLDVLYFSRATAATLRSFSFVDEMVPLLCSLSAFERLALLQRIALVSTPKKFDELGAAPFPDNFAGDVLARLAFMSAVSNAMRTMRDWTDASVSAHLPTVLDAARFGASSLAQLCPTNAHVAQAAASVKTSLAPT